jgi:hypothetical protein
LRTGLFIEVPCHNDARRQRTDPVERPVSAHFLLMQIIQATASELHQGIKPEPGARKSNITIPTHAHPLAKLVFAEMNRQGKTYLDVEWESGVLVTTIKAWRTHSRPSIETIEACLGCLGWSLIPVPRMKRLPEQLQAELEEIAQCWKLEEPVLSELLAICCKAPSIARTDRMIGRVRLSSPVNHATEITVYRTDGTSDDDIAESTGFTLDQIADLDPSDRAAILREMGRKATVSKKSVKFASQEKPA